MNDQGEQRLNNTVASCLERNKAAEPISAAFMNYAAY